MKILKEDKKTGTLELLVQSLDDLWHLERVLEPGDLVKAKTLRKETIRRGQEIVKGERKPVTLVVELEKAEFHPSTGRLRLLGSIKKGPEDIPLGSHHTIQAEPGMSLVIQKSWKRHQLERLKSAKIREPLVLICAIDRDGATFATLKAGQVEFLGTKDYKKVWGEEKRDDFYTEVLEHFRKQKGYQAIILAGPGFEAQNFQKFAKGKDPELAKQFTVEHAHSSGRAGVQEVVKRSANKVLALTRVAKESKLVEDLMAEIAKEGKVVYGPEETKKAAEIGAVETLLVSEKAVHEFEPVMEAVEKAQGTIVIISTTHEAGERFLSLGGIGGFLRFSL